MDQSIPDHGGRIDAARLRWGGERGDWIDLSTGINPVAYPVSDPSEMDWTSLPDAGAEAALIDAAREFWQVPDDLDILAAPGASALIAALPGLWPVGGYDIPGPTYNEHKTAFRAAGWRPGRDVRVIVHPNNPTGQFYGATDLTDGPMIIDESFADVSPDRSLLALIGAGQVVLKSFGKFWGLAGLRLGFAIAEPDLIARLRLRIGPWAVSGPALEVGRRALSDYQWAAVTRARLEADAARLDGLMTGHGRLVGGTPLFRLYDVGDAAAMHARLGQAWICSRTFPYNAGWLRLGLPGPGDWDRLEAAL